MDILETIQNISAWGWIGIVIIILSIVQIVPIKIDPWTWIFKRIGKVVNQEVMDKQKEIQDESKEYRRNNDINIKNILKSIDRREAEDARNRILRFGDEIKSKQFRHSQEYYNQILADITEYDKYCREHPNFKNERTVVTEKIIREAYEEHLKNNDFL